VGIVRPARRRRARILVALAIALAAVGIDPGGAMAAPEPELSAAVVGGRPVAPGEHPSLAALLADFNEPGIEARDQLMCSGTVIARRWILSAGHCAFDLAFGLPIRVQVGSRDLGDPAATTVRINRAIVHKTFFTTGAGYDIALFHTQDNVDVPPARLATSVDRPLAGAGRTATLAGWGLTRKLGIAQPPDFTARPPVRARAADIPIVGDGPCREIFDVMAPNYFVAKSDICAGTEGRNACYGDSGGPLFAKDPQGALVQIGVTSRGAGCAIRLFPGIYTDVRRLHGWIQRWTSRPCPTRFTIPDLPPDFPIELGPLFIC
jgi:secreted trypsin-like serine protease